HQVANRRKGAALPDRPSRELGRDIERLQLDQLIDGQMTIADPLKAGDISGRDVQGFQLYEVVGRDAPVTDAVEPSDIVSGDVQRLQLDELVGGNGCLTQWREASG